METDGRRKGVAILAALTILLAITPSAHATDYIGFGNRAPYLDPIGNKTVAEGSLLTFTLTAHDPDGNAITYGTIGPLPSGASLDPNTGVFTWQPVFKQRGKYPVNFTASDGSLLDYEEIIITVVKPIPPDECPMALQEAQVTVESTFGSTSDACCEINVGGIYGPSDCPLGWNSCGKKYALLVTASGVTFEGAGVHIVPTKQCCDGIKVSNTTQSLSNVVIRNVTVSDWHTGILFDDVDGGEISNSTFTQSQNGIYLSDARNIHIFSNNITDSTGYGIRVSNFGLGTFNNVIYNNYFKNLYNFGPEGVRFRPNTWNVTKQDGQRIVGVGQIGGNYWANLTGPGFSENCTCSAEGFCSSSFTVQSPDNIDWLPLCIPAQYYIDVTVTGSITGWTLPIGTATSTTAIDLRVETDAPKWKLNVYDALDLDKPPESCGKMAAFALGAGYYNIQFPRYLTNPIYITADPGNSGSYVPVGCSSGDPELLLNGVGAGTFTYDIGVQQTTVWGDIRLDVEIYRIAIVIQGMITP